MISEPGQLKKLTIDQCRQLAEEIRQELIRICSRNGGHLAPNLGVVELTIALHRVFDSPNDKLIWDVSHQTYVHKMLTGRKDRIHTIRTTGGLSGFASRSESPHDPFGAGHAGTALSAALGIAAARDRLGGDEHVVCIFGDGALTNGITFEALNNIAHTTKRFIAVLNDNQWSIARNVGAIAGYLNKLITNPHYAKLRKDVERLVQRLPKGEWALRLQQKAEEAIKGAIASAALAPVQSEVESDGRGGYASTLIFEEFGLRYIGPVDGHDLELLEEVFTFAKRCDRPVVIHVITQKGRGYEAAVRYPEKFHGTGPYDIGTGESIPPAPGTPPSYQEVFGKALVRLCQRDSRIVGITAAMPSGTGLKYLEKAMPERYFDVGIAEEHAVIFAAGMATMGFRPVVAIYSTFLQRAYDCIIHDVALQNLPVIFCMDRAGLSANDGPTHHGLFDIAFLRCVPNLVLMAPSNEDELIDMLFTATRSPHPCCIRYPRGSGEGVPIKEEPQIIEIGKADLVKAFSGRGSRRVAIFGLGPMLTLAKKAAAQLEERGVDVAVINPRFIKPLDEAIHELYGTAADVVVTIEDHVLAGGYGSAVLEFFSEAGIRTPVVRIGWPDQFIEHASTVEDLREKYGLTVEKVVSSVEEVLCLGRPAAESIFRREFTR